MAISKSQAIRDTAKRLNTTSPKAISADVKKKYKIDAPSALISTVLRNAKGSKPAKKAAPKSSNISIEDVIKAKKFAESVGGTKQAQAALAALSELQ